MIIANGTIAFKQKSGGGVNLTTGHPTPPTQYWSPAIECQYYATRMDLGALHDGEHFTRQGYTILIEGLDIPNLTESIKLSNDKAEEVGTFSIISIEPLRAVNQTKITI